MATTWSAARAAHARPDLALQFDLSLDDDTRRSAARIDADDGLAPHGATDHLSQLLDDVPFTQLADGEVSAESSPPHSPSQLHGRRVSSAEEEDDPDNWSGVQLFRHRSPSSVPLPPPVAALHNVQPAPPEPHSGCTRCAKLHADNRRLRRLLDEQAFRAAAEQIDSRAAARLDSASTSSLERRSTTAAPSRRSWLPSAPRTSFSGTRPSGTRARLRAEVQALAVTAEYLWRKLAVAERELAAAKGDDPPPPPSWTADFQDAEIATRIDPAAVLDRSQRR